VVPPSYSPLLPNKWRLDAWFHGRGETLSEVSFLYDRQRQPGEFTPPNAFVLHLYGRYCNANKFAGEVDLFEALDSVKGHYAIDPNRILVRGFSMGGAADWQFGAHFAGEWAAAAPGAGFSETADFLKVFQKETVNPTWWEQKLWRMYDATDYAVNFFNLPLVAYSGEIDNQKQAADIMAKALAAEGIAMTHIIGPNTPHRYHPDSKIEINRRLDAIAERGRDPYPRKIRFTTYTLAYNRLKWVTVDALEKHWERARIDAEIAGGSDVTVGTVNTAAFSLSMEPGACPLDNTRRPTVTIDGQKVAAQAPWSDRSWNAHFRKTAGKWAASDGPEGGQELRKRHGLQGPVDDAFLDSFLIVRPTGTPAAPGVAPWAKAEMNRAIVEWRRQFRGEAQVRDDSQITEDDIANSNLALWGDPGSNKVLARIAARLPLSWTKDEVAIGKHRYPASTHAPILIYPNPLNPKRYVVLNSGFTFREYDYLNNARQIPKIGDYAVVDTTTPPDGRFPGKLVLGGFFGERWEVLDSDGK
jgi:dienelactone hydrolase